MKLKHVVLTAIAATLALGFASCGPDKNEIPAPTIKVKAGGSDIDASTEAGVPFEITLKTDDKTSIESYTLTWKYDETRTKALTPPAKDAGGKSIKGSKEAIINITSNLFPEDATTGYLLIQLKDKNNGTANREQKTKVKDALAPTPEPEKPLMKDEKKGGIDHVGGAGKGCFDLKAGENVPAVNKKGGPNYNSRRYMINNTPAGKDKPFNAGWLSTEIVVNGTGDAGSDYPCKGNGCEFKLVTIDYAKATVEECEAAIKDGAVKEVNNVQKDQVYVAKKGDELYILKITNVDSSKNRASTGMIEFVYKRK